jgi:GDPmannose 4,6-dehydratase
MGDGKSETWKNSSIGKIIVRIDPNLYRPTKVDLLLGDASKAKAKLGWSPVYNLDQLVEEMEQKDLSLIKN